MIHKVLIAARDKETRVTIAAVVESLQLASIKASSGPLARDIVIDNPGISLIVVDNDLGEMTGRELVVDLNSKQLLVKIPVVIASDKMGINDIDQFLQLGASYFFPKPIRPKELRDYLERVLKKAEILKAA